MTSVLWTQPAIRAAAALICSRPTTAEAILLRRNYQDGDDNDDMLLTWIWWALYSVLSLQTALKTFSNSYLRKNLSKVASSRTLLQCGSLAAPAACVLRNILKFTLYISETLSISRPLLFLRNNMCLLLMMKDCIRAICLTSYVLHLVNCYPAGSLPKGPDKSLQHQQYKRNSCNKQITATNRSSRKYDNVGTYWIGAQRASRLLVIILY